MVEFISIFVIIGVIAFIIVAIVLRRKGQDFGERDQK
ncbi:hypothetical protein GGD38_002479 [Chitinophagaceae bacterium OAS944]|nr:hypothetical protein [Chitinophagaceae bacterium OAS944]